MALAVAAVSTFLLPPGLKNREEDEDENVTKNEETKSSSSLAQTADGDANVAESKTADDDVSSSSSSTSSASSSSTKYKLRIRIDGVDNNDESGSSNNKADSPGGPLLKDIKENHKELSNFYQLRKRRHSIKDFEASVQLQLQEKQAEIDSVTGDKLVENKLDAESAGMLIDVSMSTVLEFRVLDDS